ncbi:ribonuclease E [Amycolatopsis marina]|uniref:Ribonuclease E n=1 Tax=Amycolatopsis marina TaxID=490629 RepID=A0A1I0ZPE0_9PSEU|nr:translation initiation factor IF-2 N-terminal domain-containing protein [Amycolatopsis marina]SFB27232.1 ribonuclease E [Amycolatopsis marina]
MSNAEIPAENQGGTTAAPTSGPLAELPDRIRVHALAKLLGTSSKELLVKLGELGETARSAQSSVHREVALRVAASLGAIESGGEEQPAAPEAPAEQTPPPAPTATRPPIPAGPGSPEPDTASKAAGKPHVPVFAAPSPVFLPPEPAASTTADPERAASPERAAGPEKKSQAKAAKVEKVEAESPAEVGDAADTADGGDGDDTDGGRRRRRRGRRGRGRGKGGEDGPQETGEETPAGKDDSGLGGDKSGRSEKPGKESAAEDTSGDDQGKGRKGGDQPAGDNGPAEGDADDSDSDSASRRRRRRRRRKGGGEDSADGSTPDDPPNTVVHVRESKGEGKSESKGESKGDGVRSVRGSTRLEAKRQRRRDGREAGRRRAPILSESEFLARRESVERTMVVAEKGDSTQIGVLEDGVLVEHFVTSSGSGSIVGNVYLGRVQNVLPSMEAAFIDIGRGRNAVLYAGEVDWDAAGLEGKARKIEQALSTGDSVLVQVTKDPVGHKGARLTTQISLPGRFLVYVPAGGATGISRKLPENERRRLKDILKRIVPEDAGVIIRTASEGVSEEELDRDVRRLKAQWDVIKEKIESAGGNSGKKKSSAPTMLYEEPDLLVKVVRDLFTEDFAKLEVQGDTAWETIHSYVQHVAPDLADRLKRYVGKADVFADYRIDEQITKALDRKVWLPSGGYLVIDRTEAMTVIDVNTGKFTGSGGNLEETVTRNNLESAEEIVRQLRLRDIGGIIVIDFIDMVLESNRDLVLRRLTECLGRDRTRHQVAEVTSLGLVQMTRKRVGTGLLEAFSNNCEHCKGRGVVVSTEPQRVAGTGGNGGSGGSGAQQHGGGSRRSRGRGKGEDTAAQEPARTEPAPQGPTPEQRESVVTAVQAMASAAKVAQTKGGDDAGETQVSGDSPRNGHLPSGEGEQGTAQRAAAAPEESEIPAEPQRAVQAEKPPAAPTRAVRPAGPAGSAERAVTAVETSAEPAEPATKPAGEPERSTVSEVSEHTEGVQNAESTGSAVTEPAAAAPATSRRPRRRAASRPAGPPVNATETS